MIRVNIPIVSIDSIETPEWMDTKYDYTVRWDESSEEWMILPF